MSNLTIVLIITVIGMGLVFAAILLLWGVIALLVRIVKDPPEPEEAPAQPAPAVAATGDQQRRMAAAAAVAIALAQAADRSEPHEFPLPPTALVSAWQAVMRTRMLNRRGTTR
jgi:sodium pump decarboxylase gamma subunit